jgi:hypothetical protein
MLWCLLRPCNLAFRRASHFFGCFLARHPASFLLTSASPPTSPVPSSCLPVYPRRTHLLMTS